MSHAQPSAARTQIKSDITHSSPIAAHSSSAASSQDGTDSRNSEEDTEELDAEEPSSTFIRFPNLPSELRLKVWKYACCISRNLVLQLKDLRQADIADDYTPYFFYSSCPVPAVLRVCQESRAEALQHYSLDFEVHETWELERGRITFEAPATIYINWSFDRVCIFRVGELEAYDRFDRQITERLKELQQRFNRKKLRYLACELDTDEEPDLYRGYHHAELTPLFRDDNHLEEVIFFHKYESFDYSHSTHGWLDFASALEDEKQRFNYPLDDLCKAVRWHYRENENTEVLPMPFDVRCAMVLFNKGKNKGQEVQAEAIESNDKRNGTAVVMKGEIWKYKA
ncbi:hypothetical protein DL98DRAFT_69001 [Cadophora sp. DSE1049]|nr:hypothetical protein DL98DRAFT_69001 [Cadophora sp. DSE1049]